MRALDKFLYTNKNYRIAHKGIGTADGGGTNIFKCANVLLECGYEICLLMDSDISNEESEKQTLRTNGTSVFDWDTSNALEEQVFNDIPLSGANELINIATEEKGMPSVCDKLKPNDIICTVVDNEIVLPKIDNIKQKTIGTVAKHKNSEWYKRIDLGEKLGDIVFRYWDDTDDNSKLKKTVNALSTWVMKND